MGFLSMPSVRAMAFDVWRLQIRRGFRLNRRSSFITALLLWMKREEMSMKVCLAIFALAVVLTIGVPSPGSAHQVVVGKLKIGHPWVREAAEGALGTYSCIIEIQNDGDEPERLLGATIEGAGTGVLYKLTENNGHFTSRPFEDGLVIKPHGSIELPPTEYQFRFWQDHKGFSGGHDGQWDSRFREASQRTGRVHGRRG